VGNMVRGFSDVYVSKMFGERWSERLGDRLEKRLIKIFGEIVG
jgi:hypothetical protein